MTTRAHAPTAETRHKVKSLRLLGVSQVDISKVIGIAKETLSKRYAEELSEPVDESRHAPAISEHVPTKATREVVKALYGAGVSQDDISNHLGISGPTLTKYYAAELNHGSMEMGVLAIKRLARDMKSPKSGMSGTVAAIFTAKNRLGWAEKTENKGDGPTVHVGSGARVLILPSNGREQIAHQRQLARQPAMIKEQTVDAEFTETTD